MKSKKTTFMPFQVGYLEWSVYNGEEKMGWNGVEFDDGDWRESDDVYS